MFEKLQQAGRSVSDHFMHLLAVQEAAIWKMISSEHPDLTKKQLIAQRKKQETQEAANIPRMLAFYKSKLEQKDVAADRKVVDRLAQKLGIDPRTISIAYYPPFEGDIGTAVVYGSSLGGFLIALSSQFSLLETNIKKFIGLHELTHAIQDDIFFNSMVEMKGSTKLSLTLQRFYEKRADYTSALSSAARCAGGINFFHINAQSKLFEHDDPTHPPIEQRIAYLRRLHKLMLKEQA